MRSSQTDRPTPVLVVDDEEPVRRFVSAALRCGEYQVTVGADGPDALKLAETAAPFDLLVTDLLMPGMTGDELARQLRQRWPALKVLYLTGHADRLFAERLTLWEGEAFLDKPCTVKALLEATSLLIAGTAAPVAGTETLESPTTWQGMVRRDDLRGSRD